MRGENWMQLKTISSRSIIRQLRFLIFYFGIQSSAKNLFLILNDVGKLKVKSSSPRRISSTISNISLAPITILLIKSNNYRMTANPRNSLFWHDCGYNNISFIYCLKFNDWVLSFDLSFNMFQCKRLAAFRQMKTSTWCHSQIGSGSLLCIHKLIELTINH